MVKRIDENEKKLREEAIAKFEEGLRKEAEGDYAGAQQIFTKLAEEFSEIIDVAHRARQFARFCQMLLSKEEDDPAEEEVVGVIYCPHCGAELPYVRGTLSVWCDDCQRYLSLEEGNA